MSQTSLKANDCTSHLQCATFLFDAMWFESCTLISKNMTCHIRLKQHAKEGGRIYTV